MKANNGVQGTPHKVRRPLTPDVQHHMKTPSILAFSLVCLLPLVMSSYADNIHVMRGHLDPTWGGASSDSGATQRKYQLVERGIGVINTNHVFIRYMTETLLGAEPEDAILVLVPYYYDERQGVHAFEVLGGDASIGMFNYDAGLWQSLNGMTDDEILAYCTPSNMLSFDEAAQVGINYLHEKMTGATGVTLADGEDNTEESCKKLLSWSMTMRVHFSEDRYRDVVVEVNVKGRVIGDTIGF